MGSSQFHCRPFMFARLPQYSASYRSSIAEPHIRSAMKEVAFPRDGEEGAETR